MNKGVLVIVIGGNISQLLQKEKDELKLVPAQKEVFQRRLIDNANVFEKLLTNNNDDEDGFVLHEGNNLKGKQIRVIIERLDDISNIEQQDSSQVNPESWSRLITKQIKLKASDYDGIVVLHGLDTLAYTASAISFMIDNLSMPIVFTGSQRPLNYIRSDARQNIYTAITIAAAKSLGIKQINEVTIYLHDTLYRANRATMSSASSYRSFDSLNYPAIATIGDHIDVKEHLILKRSSPTNAQSYKEKTHANVQIIDVFPGMSPTLIAGIVENDLDIIYLDKLKIIAEKKIKEHGEGVRIELDVLEEVGEELNKQSQTERLSNLLPAKKRENALDIIKSLDEALTKKVNRVRGVILRTYGMGTAPTNREVLKALREVVERGIIVMNVTQAHSHRVSFNSDPVSLRLFEQGVISGLDMTSESAFAKMVVVLSDNTPSDEEKDFEAALKKIQDRCEDELQQNIAGEQSHTVTNHHFEAGITAFQNEDKAGYNYTSVLQFKNPDKDFRFDDKVLDERVDNIQLRILGLKKQNRGGKTVYIRIVKFEKGESINIAQGKPILETNEDLADPPSDNELNTINVSYDITDIKRSIFNPNSVFLIGTDHAIAWSRISIVVYSRDE